MAKHDITVGVHQGGGPPPHYRWSVHILEIAFREAVGFLKDYQYEHVSELIRELDPSHSQTQSVDAIEDFFELRDKGGVLGNVNLRVFFYLDKDRSVILILGAISKKNDGPTPLGDKVRVRNRLRKYLRGDFERP